MSVTVRIFFSLPWQCRKSKFGPIFRIFGSNSLKKIKKRPKKPPKKTKKRCMFLVLGLLLATASSSSAQQILQLHSQQPPLQSQAVGTRSTSGDSFRKPRQNEQCADNVPGSVQRSIGLTANQLKEYCKNTLKSESNCDPTPNAACENANFAGKTNGFDQTTKCYWHLNKPHVQAQVAGYSASIKFFNDCRAGGVDSRICSNPDYIWQDWCSETCSKNYPQFDYGCAFTTTV